MNIIIAGAGAVGFHLAELLTKENQSIILIDTNDEVLEYAATHLDVLTIRGDATSIEVLQKANVVNTNLFIAVTAMETTNLLSAILARQMGASRTVARINNPEYLEKAQLDNFHDLGVNWLISPQVLAAEEIRLLLQRCTFTDIFEFENGKISILGLSIDRDSPLENQTMVKVSKLNPDFNFRGIAILRNHQTIIPKGDTKLRRGDHLYLATRNHHIDQATKFVGKEVQSVHHIMIIGQTEIALRTAQLLENEYAITLVIDDKEVGKRFLARLQNTLIIQGNTGNVNLLKEEGLEQMDAFIALTPNSEINIITSLMAKELGVYKTIAQVDNADYIHISQNIGVDTIINKKLVAANEIFRFVRKGRVKAIANLHGVDAEAIEFLIHKENRLTKHPIKKLPIPKQAIIAGVIRDAHSFIPDGEFVFEKGDKVIVFTLPEALHRVEELFK
ncbi:MAG: Trk system potassium transporter TrkA [Bacteroidota bacterium]